MCREPHFGYNDMYMAEPHINEEIDEICLLMDEYLRRGERRDNKLIVEIILGYAHIALRDDGMLNLLQEMERLGDNIPWALNCTGMSTEQLNSHLYDIVNEKPQPRYYLEPITIGEFTYYISSQWYSHIDYPNQKQTKKALLQLIVDIVPEEHTMEFLQRLNDRVLRHIS